ncbi:type I-E CRISPR-associated protein Cse1/CasA [Pikeienuella sp. HZG-20]|uniref:type I-E CRISPR-associated protein Cse1/CasA n=1 Tax=Paludibacillus litoralis TaxID=3133267 RepID=UPI0030EE4353
MLNLITCAWIPVRTTGGPRVIRPDQIAEPGVQFPDWPRADLNLACLEFLIGLMFLAAPPGTDEAWSARRDPDPERLRMAMEPLAPAFELLGAGPRFLQEPISINEEPKAPDMLLIDSAGASTIRKNGDLMVRGDRYPVMSPPMAAMALFALQAFAPSGGAGNRTSMRGGGPMVTLARPDAEGASPLWSLVWANVPNGRPIRDLSQLPWMRSAPRTSESNQIATPMGPGTAPEPETFFGMPRRLWLVSETRERAAVVTGVQQRPWGANYGGGGWLHPLTPYYKTKEGKLPRHPKPGHFGYRNWRGVVLQGADVDRAATLETFFRRTEWGGDKAMRLIVGGWAMNNMSPVDFLWSEQPTFVLSPEQEFRAADMVEAAEQTSYALAAAVRDGKNEGVGAGAALRAREALFHLTQGAFEEQMARLAEDSESTGDQWLHILRKTALSLFDVEVGEGLPDLQPTQREKAVIARRLLLATMAGRTKTGAKIYECLGLPVPSKRREPA